MATPSILDIPGVRDARRLAACWTACEGISTESLEQNVLADLIVACEDTLRELGDIDPINGRLRAAINAARGETT